MWGKPASAVLGKFDSREKLESRMVSLVGKWWSLVGGDFTRVTIGDSHRVDVADRGVGVGIRLPVGSVRDYP